MLSAKEQITSIIEAQPYDVRSRRGNVRWLEWIEAAVVVLALTVVWLMPRLNDFDRSGRLHLPGLQKGVKVVRDENGMAYIHAAGKDDLAHAQGFVTAQDRHFRQPT